MAAAMSFLDLQNELISVPAARFKETQRASVMRWLNLAYAKLWVLDDWTFRQATGSPTVTAGSSTVGSVPTDFSNSLGFWRADGCELNYLKPRAFYNRYAGQTTTGKPSDFTVVNGAVSVGPVSNETATYTLLYGRAAPELDDDGDVPLIPDKFHYLLVHGATIVGLVQEQDFTYQFQAGQWQEGVQTMQMEYLDDQRGQPAQFGSYDHPSAWALP